MLAIASLLIVVTLSILVTRIAALALVHTGLSREAARFQARSAFTGAGFTTSESENVVNHPVRRRIVLVLMLLGNAGIVTGVSSLILSFVDRGDTSALVLRVGLLVGGLIFLWAVALSTFVDRHLCRLIDAALSRYTRLDVSDYASLLHLVGEYRLAEIEVDTEDWMADRKLSELRLRDEGLIVLGVHRRDGTYLGAPSGSTQVRPRDKLLVYGRTPALQKLDERRRGAGSDAQHEQAVAEQTRVREAEEIQDAAANDGAGRRRGPVQDAFHR